MHKIWCKISLLLGIVIILGGCAGYEMEVDFCIEESCVKIKPHLVHWEILEPVHPNKVGE